MTDIGSTTHKLSAAPSSPASWGRKFDALLDQFIDFMTRILCRASRGYLCPPDMTSVMYPDEPRPLNSRTKECCDEKLPGK
jgi:hypothetical protein